MTAQPSPAGSTWSERAVTGFSVMNGCIPAGTRRPWTTGFISDIDRPGRGLAGIRNIQMMCKNLLTPSVMSGIFQS